MIHFELVYNLKFKYSLAHRDAFMLCNNKPCTWMSPLWGPLCPYIHSTVAFLVSHMWIRKSGRLLMGSSTRGSWGGRYIQPMMKSPSTWMTSTFQKNALWIDAKTAPCCCFVDDQHLTRTRDQQTVHCGHSFLILLQMRLRNTLLTTTLSNPP